MRAFITELTVQTGDNKFFAYISFYNESNGQYQTPSFGIDIPFSTTSNVLDLNQSIVDGILAEAVSRSYSGFAEKDIIWNITSPIDRFDALISKGVWSSVIDGKSVGNTTMFTNNSGKKFMVTNVMSYLVNIAGLGTAPIVSVGKTSSTFNDVATGLTLSILTTAGAYSNVPVKNNAVSLANGESLVVRVSTAAILTTTYDFQIMVQGIYF